MSAPKPAEEQQKVEKISLEQVFDNVKAVITDIHAIQTKDGKIHNIPFCSQMMIVKCPRPGCTKSCSRLVTAECKGSLYIFHACDDDHIFLHRYFPFKPDNDASCFEVLVPVDPIKLSDLGPDREAIIEGLMRSVGNMTIQ